MPEDRISFENISAAVYRQTSLEKLADLLFDDLMGDIADVGHDPADVFFHQPEVITPNKSMRRYLTMRLAARTGIASGIRFSSLMSLFPSNEIDAASIGWRIYRILQADQAQFPALNAWIGGDAKRRYDLSNQLGQLYYQYMLYRPEWLNVWEKGGTPEELMREQSASWQGRLWRMTAGKDWRGRHFAAKYDSLMHGHRPGWTGKPRKIRIFGFSQLAPAVMECLAILSRHGEETRSGSGALGFFSGAEADVSLYQLVPSLKLFYDERNRTFKEEIKELIRLLHPAGDRNDAPDGETAPGEPVEVAAVRRKRRDDILSRLFFLHNPLIASFGTQSRVTMTLTEDLRFQDGLDPDDPDVQASLSDDDPNAGDSGAVPGGNGAADDTILARLQRNILRDLRGRETAPPPLDPEQKEACHSVQIRDCYSAFREVEAARNFILHCLEESPGLTLNDIFIMTPSSATAMFAPLVDAVFNHAPEQERLSVSIADRPQTEELPSYRTFLKILALYKGEFTATDIFAILQDSAVQARIGVTTDDCRTFRDLAVRAGIRWGWDAEDHRAEKTGGIGFSQNSWQAGIDRLLLHYAMDIAPETPFEAAGETLFAVQGYRGGAGVTLGKIAHYIGRLHDFAREMRRRSTDGMAFRLWRDELMQAAAEFFGPESELGLLLAGILKGWGDILTHAQEQPAEASGAASGPGWETDDTPLTTEIVLVYLQGQIKESGDSTKGFMRGSITFCGLKPMRSIPADVIVLLGMNHEAFPGDDAVSEFDLMRKSKRPGDPDKRSEARQLFLDVILAARKYLYISYVGRNIHDRKESPPSVCVDVLRSYLEQEFGKNSFVDIREPLQAFSPELFEPWPAGTPCRKPNQSYSRNLLEAAKLIRTVRTQPPRPLFQLDELSQPPDEALLRISPDDLGQFFRNSLKTFAEKRLDASVFVFQETVPEDFESFGGAIDYKAKQDLLALYLRNRPATPDARANFAENCLERLKADGAVPLTQTPDAWAEWESVSALGDAVAAETDGTGTIALGRGEMTFPCGVTLTLPETELHGDDRLCVQILPCLSKDITGNLMVEATLRHLVANLRTETATRIVSVKLADPGKSSRKKKSSIEPASAVPDVLTPSGKVVTVSVLEALPMKSDAAGDAMNSILMLYREGICGPLPFFPNTLYALLRGSDYKSQWSGGTGNWSGQGDAPKGEVEKFGMFYGEVLPPEADLKRIMEAFFLVDFLPAAQAAHSVPGNGGEGDGEP